MPQIHREYEINSENAKVPAEKVDKGHAEVAAAITPDPSAGYRRARRVNAQIPHHHHEARKHGDENHLRTYQLVVKPIQKNMSYRPRDIAHREIGRHDQQRHQPKLWTKLVGVDVVTEWESGQDARGLVAPADHEREDEKDNEGHPTVPTYPMHDGKAHEYRHRNEWREPLQVGIVQQPSGTNEHVESNENPKQYIRYSALITHGCCPSFQPSWLNKLLGSRGGTIFLI
jgi:hypothetical protein